MKLHDVARASRAKHLDTPNSSLQINRVALRLALQSPPLRYLPGWGKSVVIGRGKLGGVPMGVIAVETRSFEVKQSEVPVTSSKIEMCRYSSCPLIA